MKRISLAVFVGAFVLAPVFSQGMDMGSFPLGSWFDATYDAVWEIKSGSIRILSTDGSVFYDFGRVAIQNFKVGAGGDGPFISFSCEATGKSYKLTKPLTSSSVILEIDRPSLPHYKVEMSKR